MPPVAVTFNCLLAMVCPFCFARIVTCQVPPVWSRPGPSYRPLPLSASITVVRIAAMPIAGIAGMNKMTLTSAPEIGEPLLPVILTLKMLLPLCGGFGSELNSAFAWGVFIAAAAPTPGGGGAKEQSAARNWLY